MKKEQITELLNKRIRQKKLTKTSLAKTMNICRYSLIKKVQFTSCFTIKELNQLQNILDLDDDIIENIENIYIKS